MLIDFRVSCMIYFLPLLQGQETATLINTLLTEQEDSLKVGSWVLNSLRIIEMFWAENLGIIEVRFLDSSVLESIYAKVSHVSLAFSFKSDNWDGNLDMAWLWHQYGRSVSALQNARHAFRWKLFYPSPEMVEEIGRQFQNVADSPFWSLCFTLMII